MTAPLICPKIAFPTGCWSYHRPSIRSRFFFFLEDGRNVLFPPRLRMKTVHCFSEKKCFFQKDACVSDPIWENDLMDFDLQESKSTFSAFYLYLFIGILFLSTMSMKKPVHFLFTEFKYTVLF